MVVLARYQDKRTMCIALYNAYLHKNSMCPGNHEVHYNRGWFYLDGKPFHFPEITKKADECLARNVKIMYSRLWNTYVVGE